MTDNFPTGWRVLAVPSNWDPTAKELNIRPVFIRERFLSLPDDFFMTIQTPEMIAQDETTAIVVSFRTTPTGVETRRITGVGPDWVGCLGNIVQHFPPSDWEKRAEELMAKFLQFPETREPVTEAMQQLPLWRLEAGANRPTAEVGIQRRRKITPEHLQEVARVYLTAQANEEPPTRAVQNHFAVSHSTAAKWVGAARRAELLPPHED